MWRVLLSLCLSWAALACSPHARPRGDERVTQPGAPASSEPATPSAPARVTLVESTPIETSLGSAAVPDTAEVWPEMIAAAHSTIELAHFYASTQTGGELEPVIEALEQAAARGVRVRMLFDRSLSETYAETFARLERAFELRVWDASFELGGIQHAKYLIIDNQQAFVGSANFDWRSLSHIHEIGLRLEVPALAAALGSLFEMDWTLALPGPTPRPAVRDAPWAAVQLEDGQLAQLVASPRGWLPNDAAWELDQLLTIIGGARRRLSVELLEYGASFRDGSPFPALQDALAAAAARGVSVRMLVSNWVLRHPEALQRLQLIDGIDVAVVTIPAHSGGFIPFARVIHAKYAVADGEIAWIGSSNWQGDYFHNSRNVGVVVRGARIAAQLEGLFGQLRGSAYARPIDPAASYQPPRIGP